MGRFFATQLLQVTVRTYSYHSSGSCTAFGGNTFEPRAADFQPTAS